MVDPNQALTVLVTGFRPFAGRPRNGSETVVRALEKWESGKVKIHSEVLDVKWGCPEENLPDLITRLNPDLVLGLGEGQDSVMCFERIAFNRASGIDEAGNPPPFAPLLRPEGPAHYQTSMRFDPAWLEGVAPCRESNDAGSFLCNSWLFTALEHDACPSGFIHLPIQGDTADQDYVDHWGPAILEIIRRCGRNSGLGSASPFLPE